MNRAVQQRRVYYVWRAGVDQEGIRFFRDTKHGHILELLSSGWDGAVGYANCRHVIEQEGCADLVVSLHYERLEPLNAMEVLALVSE